MRSFHQSGLVCPICRGFIFIENEDGQLICEQCGTVSEVRFCMYQTHPQQSHQTQVEEDYTAIQKDQYGVSVRRKACI